MKRIEYVPKMVAIMATALNVRREPEMARFFMVYENDILKVIKAKFDTQNRVWYEVHLPNAGEQTGWIASWHTKEVEPESIDNDNSTQKYRYFEDAVYMFDKTTKDLMRRYANHYSLSEKYFKFASECKTPFDFVSFLNPTDAKYLRYQPRDGDTFCNIFAHDYCHLRGAYLPRVWWLETNQHKRGDLVAPIWGRNVREMNANSLTTWLENFGSGFDWKFCTNDKELQQKANEGKTAIICARAPRRIGHVTVVIPSMHTFVNPMQAQAGVRNFLAEQNKWYKDSRYDLVLFAYKD